MLYLSALLATSVAPSVAQAAPTHDKLVRIRHRAHHGPWMTYRQAARLSRHEGKHIVGRVAIAHGYGRADRRALYEIITGESGFNPTSANPHSSARGIGQLLKDKWRGHPWWDAYWNTDRTLRYIKGRYGTVQRALAHKRSHGWY
jgi:hypothetical protein